MVEFLTSQMLTSYIIPLLAPVLLVFRHLFWGNLATWGDAPFFYAEGLKNLIAEPLAWTERGLAFGGVNNLIWINPLMALYGLIGNNDLAIRLIFYLPSLILAGVGIFFLTKYLKSSKVVSFFAVLTYLLNTYYILLIDGGQVGVALAYGIFPLVLLCLKKFFDTPNAKTFFSALILSFLLSVADPRVVLICIVAIALWILYEGKFKKLMYLFPLGAALTGLSMYWLYPFIKNGIASIPTLSYAALPKWYHPLTLLAPNWPDNLFGKVSAFNPYFLGLPLLILIGLIFKRNKDAIVYFSLFLTFSLLALGIIPFEKTPFGFIFRDLTKFFIPAVLFAAILIGRSVESLQSKYRSKIFPAVIYGYLLFLIYPALAGKPNFVLSGKQEKSDFQKIYQNLKGQEGVVRTAWFPEKHPLAYEAANQAALDARELVRFRPFAQMNTGEDPFNFLNNSGFIDWFRILGIRYLVLSGNPREVTKSESEEKNWMTITKLAADNPNLERVNWGTNIPIYKVNDAHPRFFAVKKLTAVVGTLPADKYPLPNTVFFEDGKLDPTLLEGKPAEAVEIIFNKKDKTDLAMSFLQKYFVSPKEASKSRWATFTASDYLKYKYELLIRGYQFDDFDYGRGIAFSTVKGEKINFRLKTPEKTPYVLAVRRSDMNHQNLKWDIQEVQLERGTFEKGIFVYEPVNESGLEVINVVALIPRKDYEAAVAKADVFIKHFKVVGIDALESGIEYQEVGLVARGTLKYDFTTPGGYRWVILNGSYHPLWKLRKGPQYLAGVPAFSMVNAFYVDEGWTDYGLVFKGQDNVRWGIYWSVASALILSIIYLRFSGKKYV